MEHMAQWKNVTKTFGRCLGKTQALDNFNFEVNEGDTAALVGNNGSGKSTAVKCLMGLLTTTTGTVRLRGKPPQLPEARRNLGYLPESFGTFPDARVGDILENLDHLKGLPEEKREDRLHHVKNHLNLDSIWDTSFQSCSHGERRRVGLAQAINGSPEFLVLDEPTDGLDPKTQEQFQSMISERKNSGKTTLIITHRMDEVKQLCDRAAVLRDGSIQTMGSTDEILDKFQAESRN